MGKGEGKEERGVGKGNGEREGEEGGVGEMRGENVGRLGKGER